MAEETIGAGMIGGVSGSVLAEMTTELVAAYVPRTTSSRATSRG